MPAPAHEGRYLIRFTEFARLNIPEVWKGERNPVRYGTLEELGIDPSTLEWEPMPEPSKKMTASAGVGALRPLTLSEAKRELAVRFDVPPDAVEITIRV